MTVIDWYIDHGFLELDDKTYTCATRCGIDIFKKFCAKYGRREIREFSAHADMNTIIWTFENKLCSLETIREILSKKDNPVLRKWLETI
jgi:hypothetical protein